LNQTGALAFISLQENSNRIAWWDEKLDLGMGLFRKIMVVGGALIVMPSPPSAPQTGGIEQAAAPSSSWAYIAAAADTVADMKSFCERKPNVCGTAQYLAGSLEGKAKYGARLVYEWANESASGLPRISALPLNEASIDLIHTGSAEPRLMSSPSGNSTLRMEDLIPEWRGTISSEKS
jgi:Family of unknown function (DUF5330)